MSHPSRIPQHVPTGSQSRYTQAVDASHVYTNLLALGAPPISLDDFNRLYHGPFGELLLFMSTQIKGRKQVARDRYLIHQFRESHSQLPVRVPGEGTTVAPVQKCMAELSDAQRKADVLSVQLKASQADLEQTQSQATNLKQMLQDRRRATMLLGILQQRERVRISRFQEMIKMMEKLRTTSVETASTIKPTMPASLGLVIPPLPTIFNLHTHTAVTNLHAYHVRLYRIKETEHEPSPLLTSRLRLRLTKKVQADQLERVVERCCDIARVKAKKKTRYHDAVLSELPSISKVELSDRAKANDLKRQELQRLSDNAIALGFLCEHLITSISVFLEKTSPILRLSLHEDIPRAKGYIDALRLHLSASSGTNAQQRQHSFVEEVERLCGIRTSQEPGAVLHAVEGLLKRVHEKSSYLAAVDALHVPRSQTPEEEALIAEYRAGLESVEKRARDLLTRKADKAVLGGSLIDDLDILLKDVRTLVK